MGRSQEEILDELLILGSQSGDQLAWRQLVERWHARLLAHAFRLLGRPDAAADVTQEAWLSMVRSIRRLEDPARFRPWAFRIVANKAADWGRNRRVERDQLGVQEALDSRVIDTSTVPTDETKEKGQRLRLAIRHLPPDKRHLISMFYLEQMSLADIADALRVPIGTIKSRLYAIRQELKDQLEVVRDARN